MECYIKDYDSLYNEQIDFLDDNYWGDNAGNEKLSEDIKENDIFKMAFFDDELIGFLHFKQIGDLIDCSNVLVKEEYRKHNVATKLMNEALLEVNKRNIKTLVAHAVEHDGIINSKRLLENFGFEEVYSVKNYWKSLYPGEFCKQCKSNDCHCGVVVYLKKI